MSAKSNRRIIPSFEDVQPPLLSSKENVGTCFRLTGIEWTKSTYPNPDGSMSMFAVMTVVNMDEYTGEEEKMSSGALAITKQLQAIPPEALPVYFVIRQSKRQLYLEQVDDPSQQ